MNIITLKKAFPYTIPVMMGYIPMGIAFGVLLSSQGYAFYWSTLMAVLIYAGSMQFVAVGLLTHPVSLFTVALITLSINARHLFYGLSLLDNFGQAGLKKLYLIFGLTDETYSLICGIKPPADVKTQDFYFCLSALNQFYWVLGCTIGGVLGNLISFDVRGMDFAMTALFLVIFIEQWLATDNHIPALLGVFVTIACLLLFGSQNFVMAAMVGIAIFFALLKKYIDKEEMQTHE